jgi:outer membrane protein OmpA-like peptidoglycan-associated protein
MPRLPSKSPFALASLVAAVLVLASTSAISAASTAGARLSPLVDSASSSSTGNSFDAVTCVSATRCVAVGQLGVAAGGVALIDVESAGAWSYRRAPMPSDASTTSPNGVLDAVSCASASGCVAVGSYANTVAGSTDQQALIDVGTGGAWATVAVPLPAGASSTPQNSLDSVSCSSVGNCTAVGTYESAAGNQRALLVVETAGTWAAVVAALPVDADAAHPDDALDAVTCTTAIDCVAVGSYVSTSPSSTCPSKDCLQALMDVEAAGTWAAVVAPLPPNATGSPQNGNSLAAVTCTSTANCVAVGSYVDTAGGSEPLLDAEASGSWTAVVAPLPGDASATPNTDSLTAVTCVSQGNCVAVGQYDSKLEDPEGLIETETTGTWAAATAPVPGDADVALPDVLLTSVSCSTLTSCVAVGSYEIPPIRNLSPDALLDAEVDGVWVAGTVDLPGDASTAQPYSDLAGVTCVAPWSCVAVGLYVNTDGLYQVILDAFGVALTTLPVVPSTPNTVVATVGHGQASVGWIAPASTGGSPITSYTATASPGGARCTASSLLRCRIWPLRGNTTYTFDVVATNEVGSSPPSISSYPVTTLSTVDASVTIGSFAPNSSRLTGRLRSQIVRLAQTILLDGTPRISLLGYSDTTGSASQIQRVSLQRARAVATWLRAALTAEHAGPTTITVAARGDANPVASNKTPEGRASNRRVVATLT